MTLEGIALIIGAGSGIGRETAYTFAEKAISGLFLADINETSVAETAKESKALASNTNFKVLAIKVDVTDRESVISMVNTAVSTFGRIDYCVNSAGIGTNMEASVIDMPTEEFDRVYNTNARGTFFCTSEVAKVMTTQDERHTQGRSGKRSLGRGCIVNLSSLNAEIPVPMHVQYGASKYAACGITYTAASELARKGVRVNCLLPSWVDTAMMAHDFQRQTDLPEGIKMLSPAGRMAYPEEISEAIYFLCSPGASYISGIGLVVDAGVSLTRGLA